MQGFSRRHNLSRAEDDARCPRRTTRRVHLWRLRSKNLGHLRTTGYEGYGIHGEVCLWGKVVEHEQGYRAQLAYPKNFFLSPDALPFTLAEIQSRLKMLTTYCIDIFLADPKRNIPLWAKGQGIRWRGFGLPDRDEQTVLRPMPTGANLEERRPRGDTGAGDRGGRAG